MRGGMHGQEQEEWWEGWPFETVFVAAVGRAAGQFSAAVVVVGARRLALHSCHCMICDSRDHRVRREGSILHSLMAKVSMK